MKNILISVALILAFIGVLGSCSDSSSNSEYTGYSKTYNNDAEYRKDVKGIADAFGVSEREVDRKINAVTGGR